MPGACLWPPPTTCPTLSPSSCDEGGASGRCEPQGAEGAYHGLEVHPLADFQVLRFGRGDTLLRRRSCAPHCQHGAAGMAYHGVHDRPRQVAGDGTAAVSAHHDQIDLAIVGPPDDFVGSHSHGNGDLRLAPQTGVVREPGPTGACGSRPATPWSSCIGMGSSCSRMCISVSSALFSSASDRA